MCTIKFAQTLLANDNTGVNQESSSFALSEPMNGMSVVKLIFICITQFKPEHVLIVFV